MADASQHSGSNAASGGNGRGRGDELRHIGLLTFVALLICGMSGQVAAETVGVTHRENFVELRFSMYIAGPAIFVGLCGLRLRAQRLAWTAGALAGVHLGLWFIDPLFDSYVGGHLGLLTVLCAVCGGAAAALYSVTAKESRSQAQPDDRRNPGIAPAEEHDRAMGRARRILGAVGRGVQLVTFVLFSALLFGGCLTPSLGWFWAMVLAGLLGAGLYKLNRAYDG